MHKYVMVSHCFYTNYAYFCREYMKTDMNRFLFAFFIGLMLSCCQNSSIKVRSERARESLQSIKEKNLSDTLLTDSDAQVIKEVSEYYRAYGNRHQLAESLYLMGSVYRDMGDAPMALSAFHEALTVAQGGRLAEMYPLLERIYSQIGSIHRRQSNLEGAWESYSRALEIAQLACDTVYALSAEWMIMSIQSLKGNDEYVASEAPRLIQASLAHGDSSTVVSNLIGVVMAQTRLRQYKEAKNTLSLYETMHNGVDDNPWYYVAKAELYVVDGKTDSAEITIRGHEDNLNWNSRQAMFRVMESIYEARCQTDSALKYSMLRSAAIDSTYKHQVTANAINMQSLYDYSRYREQQLKSEEKIKDMKFKSVITIILFILLLSILAILFFRQRYKTAERDKLSAESMLDMERHISQVERCLSEKEKIIDDATLALSDKDNLLAQYRKELADYKITIQEQESNDVLLEEYRQRTIELEDRIKMLTEQIDKDTIELNNKRISLQQLSESMAKYKNIDMRLLDSGGAQKIIDKCISNNTFPTDEEWRMLEYVTCRMYPNTITRLNSLAHRVRDTKLRCVILSLLDVPLSKMPRLIGRSRQAINSVFSRLYTDVCKTKATNYDEIHTWLQEMEKGQ